MAISHGADPISPRITRAREASAMACRVAFDPTARFYIRRRLRASGALAAACYTVATMRPRVLPTSALSLGLVLACSADPNDTTGTEGTTTATSTGESTSSGALEPTTEVTTADATTDATAGTSIDPTTGPSDATGSSTVDPTTGTTDALTATTDGSDTTTGTTTETTTGTSAETTTDTTGGDPGELSCPLSIDQAILACVLDLQNNPDPDAELFLIDLLFACSDAEPVADDYDAHCAEQPRDPICALDYAEFVASVLPECVTRAQETLFADVCLLPDFYGELLFTPAIALMQRRFVTSADQLDPGEQSQILWASADIGFPVDTVEEALLATDDDGMEQLMVLDVGTDRTLVSYSGHYGDTRVGRVFLQGTLTVVGAIEDSEFVRCGVERTIEGQPCVDELVCAPDHVCNDILTEMDDVLAPGVCISPGPLPGEGQPCSAHADCDPASGLLCLDSLSEGTCRPGWMRRSFAGPDSALVPGGVLEIPILVSGLATVPTGAYLDLQLFQDAPNAIEVRLVNPLGTTTTVSATDAPLIDLELAPMPVPGDESAGGVWHLVVEDIGGQASGAVNRLALTLDTRWD